MCFRKNLEHHLPNEVFRVLSSIFFGRIWMDMTTVQIFIYIYTHARFSVYNLSKKMCDQWRKGYFFTMTFLRECSSLSTRGWPAVSGEDPHFSQWTSFIIASYQTLKSSTCGKKHTVSTPKKQTHWETPTSRWPVKMLWNGRTSCFFSCKHIDPKLEYFCQWLFSTCHFFYVKKN